MKYRKITHKNLNARFAAILIIAAVFVCVLAVLSGADSVAYAAQDNFEVIFPQNNYFQSANPALIGANKDYLLVYDSVSSKIYARSNSLAGTWTYDVSFENVVNVFAIGDSAFIYADGKYYVIDLTDKNSTAVEKTLTSPQDISYFNSDGSYLYAKSTAGYITVYDDDFEIAFECDDKYNDDLLAGKPVIAGENETLFVFTIVYGNPFFVKYNLDTDVQSNGIALSKYVQEAYVGDVIYALETIPNATDNSTKNIIGIDKENGEILFSTDITPDKFFAFGSRLFSIEGRSIVIYTLSSEKTSLIKTSTISMAGSDDYHFDSPVDVVKTADGIAVADFGNNRVSFINDAGQMSCVYLEFAPISLTANSNEVYVAGKDRICKITDKSAVSEYRFENVADLTFLDKLYVLTADGVYTLLGSTPIKLCSIANGRRIANAQNGTNVYILKDDEIATINRNGTFLPSLLSGDFSQAKDFAVDYAGKISVIYPDSISQYYKSELTEEIALTSSAMTATVTGACLDGKTLYFTADECFVGRCNLNATIMDEYLSQPVEISASVSYSFMQRANEIATFLPSDGRIEGISISSNDTLLVFDKAVDGDENLAYAMRGDEMIIINKNDFNTVDPNALNGEFAATKSTVLYALPYVEEGIVSVESGARFSLISDCANYDNNKWTIVRYNDSVYFAKSADIAKYEEIIPEKDRTYGKANADRVGGLVNIFSDQSVDSQVLMQIVDGTKVEVLETVGDFYVVYVDGTTGYMLKDDVVLDGLTTVQIVAIVLCIIVVIAGSAIFASVHLTRKNEEEKKNKQSAK